MRALTEYGRKMVCFKVFTLLDRVFEREVGFCNCMEVSMGCVTELPHHALLRGLHENWIRLLRDRLPSHSNFSHFLQFLSRCKTRVRKISNGTKQATQKTKLFLSHWNLSTTNFSLANPPDHQQLLVADPWPEMRQDCCRLLPKITS